VSTLGLKPISTTTWSLEQGPFGAIQSVLNWLLPRRANRLYAVLKSVEPISWHERVAWWALAAIAAPFAALEFVLSATLGRGAVVTLLAIKE